MFAEQRTARALGDMAGADAPKVFTIAMTRGQLLSSALVERKRQVVCIQIVELAAGMGLQRTPVLLELAESVVALIPPLIKLKMPGERGPIPTVLHVLCDSTCCEPLYLLSRQPRRDTSRRCFTSGTITATATTPACAFAAVAASAAYTSTTARASAASSATLAIAAIASTAVDDAAVDAAPTLALAIAAVDVLVRPNRTRQFTSGVCPPTPPELVAIIRVGFLLHPQSTPAECGDATVACAHTRAARAKHRWTR